jgi:hypothetical protein
MQASFETSINFSSPTVLVGLAGLLLSGGVVFEIAVINCRCMHARQL